MAYTARPPQLCTVNETNLAMARRCELTGKAVQSGHNVSHSNIKSKRRFLPNVQETSLLSDALKRSIRLKISMAALRSVEHNGGLDNFLAKARDTDLSLKARRLKKQVLAARESAQAAA